MANKITQKDYYNATIKALKGEAVDFSTDDLVKFLEGRLEVLANKSGSRKPTKVQVENESAKGKILEVLSTDEGMKVADILKVVDFSDFSFEPTSQKVSALLKQMVDNGSVVKTVDKKVSLFTRV
jgi:TusA-related sulfurtransferase